MKTHYSVGLGYKPDDLRFGSINKLDYFFERRRNQSLLQGSLRLFDLQSKYARSYVENSTLTVLSYRDMLMSLALSLSIRCTQTRDVIYTEMTTHASRYWKTNGNNFWNTIPLYEEDPLYTSDSGFYGLAGSLAFWMYKHEDPGNGLYPIELLNKMLEYFWQDLGVNESLPVSEKLDSLLSLTAFSSSLFSQYENLLTKLLLSDITKLAPDIQQFVYRCRRALITLNDINMLPQRVLLGEFSNEVMNLLIELETLILSNRDFRQENGFEISQPYLQIFFETILSWAAPSGFPLVMIALTIEGLVKAITKLTNRTDLHQVNYSDFLGSAAESEFRVALAEDLATVYDACAALGTFNTIYESRGLSYRFYLAATQLIQSSGSVISKQGATRLYRFVEP